MYQYFVIRYMKNTHIFFLAVATVCVFMVQSSAFSQTNVSLKVVGAKDRQPLEGVTVSVMPSGQSFSTNPLGKCFLRLSSNEKNIILSSIGYETKSIDMASLKDFDYTVALLPRTIELAAITVPARAGDQYKAISKTDIEMRGVNNSQEVLRIIPGVVIGQHQGGGKAEQIFLRGFDCDHGTDFREDVDGLPINMPSHAHGQGYADSHFIIPETISGVDFRKGLYLANKGDFATTGSVDYHIKDFLPGNLVKLEGGMFNTFRALGMFNLLSHQTREEKQESWYVASEYRYSDAYFDNPQHFTRLNLFTKYNGKIAPNNYLTLSAATFWSKWNASGQIPERAVTEHIIGFYGALDPLEGGLTYRTNANAQLLTSLNNGDIIKNQLYYSNYHFDLHTDFTFYLVDTVNGDEIRQREARDLVGYNGSYNHSGYLGNIKSNTEAGVNVRIDATHNSELSHTKDRFITLAHIKLGDIAETNIAPYISQTFDLNKHFSINAGLRYDEFYHKYNNKQATDSTLNGAGTYKASAGTLSPKLSFYYHVRDGLQFYLTTGRGFHSNDTRAVVVENGNQILPAAYGADLGTVFKPVKNVIVSAAVWYIYLQQEFVYGGDGGSVEFSGPTKRYGFDFSGRYEPLKSLFFDLDVNYAHARATGVPKGEGYVPLAPVWTSSAGLTYLAKKGFNGSLRYRYISDRPANESNTLTAVGYFVTDAVINYTKPKYEIGLAINNIFNTKWKETQFDTVTRLKSEAAPVDEICFTPGTPFAAKLSLAINF